VERLPGRAVTTTATDLQLRPPEPVEEEISKINWSKEPISEGPVIDATGTIGESGVMTIHC
jgi:hypothetical protein